jgi:hypothetical protein
VFVRCLDNQNTCYLVTFVKTQLCRADEDAASDVDVGRTSLRASSVRNRRRARQRGRPTRRVRSSGTSVVSPSTEGSDSPVRLRASARRGNASGHGALSVPDEGREEAVETCSGARSDVETAPLLVWQRKGQRSGSTRPRRNLSAREEPVIRQDQVYARLFVYYVHWITLLNGLWLAD